MAKGPTRFHRIKIKIKDKLWGLNKYQKRMGNKGDIQDRLDKFFKVPLDTKKYLPQY